MGTGERSCLRREDLLTCFKDMTRRDCYFFAVQQAARMDVEVCDGGKSRLKVEIGKMRTRTDEDNG